VRSLQEWELEKSLWLSIQCESVAKLFPWWRKKGVAIHRENGQKQPVSDEKNPRSVRPAQRRRSSRPSAPRLVQIRQPAARRGRDADAATHAAAAGGRPVVAAVGDTRCSLALALAQACRAAAGTNREKDSVLLEGGKIAWTTPRRSNHVSASHRVGVVRPYKLRYLAGVGMFQHSIQLDHLCSYQLKQ